MRWMISIVGMALLAPGAPGDEARSTPGGRSCSGVEIEMGQAVEIGASEVVVRECTLDQRECFLVFCWGDVEAFVRPMAVADCTLQAPSRAHSLHFSVQSAAEKLRFVPPFSGRLTCDGLEKSGISIDFDSDEVVRSAGEAGYDCTGTPVPLPTASTRVLCEVAP